MRNEGTNMVRINCGCGSNIRLALTSAVLLALSVTWGSVATRGADEPADSGGAKPADSSATKPGDKPYGKSPSQAGSKTPAKPDPFALPKSKADLFPLVARMKKVQPPRNLSEDDKKAFLAKAHWAIVAAVDKILVGQPTPKQRYLAIQSKLEALNYLDTVAYDNQAGQELHDYVDSIKQDKQPDIARLAEQYASAGHVAATGPG